MTLEEKNRRVKALELIYLALNDPRADTKIADLLAAWEREQDERNARACRHVAAEWRDGFPDASVEAQHLRERSAESAELCARRIAPWVRSDERSVTSGENAS